MSADYQYKKGDKVRVRKDVGEPRYDWGGIKHDEIGVVADIDSDGSIYIDFPSQSGWHGIPSETELVGKGSSRSSGSTGPDIEGVSFDEAKVILALEKFGILGRKKVDLQPGGECPCTDGQIIYLPERITLYPYKKKPKEDFGNDPNLTLYVGNLFHEASHIRYGSFLVDFNDLLKKDFSNPELAHAILNIVEDTRVEYMFKGEFIEELRKVKPLLQTQRYIVKISDTEKIEDPLSRLLALLCQKSVADYTHGELVGNTKEEEKFLRTKYSTKKGQTELIKIFDEISLLISEIKNPEATVLDSMEKTKLIYQKLEEIFGQKIKDIIPPQPITQPYDFDKGPVKFSDEKDLASQQKREEFEKHYEKLKEEMQYDKKDLEKEVKRLVKEGRLPDEYIPEKLKVPKGFIKKLLEKLSKQQRSQGGKMPGQQGQSGQPGAEGGEQGEGEPGDQDGTDPLVGFVRKKLEEKGYAKPRAKEISDNIYPGDGRVK